MVTILGQGVYTRNTAQAALQQQSYEGPQQHHVAVFLFSSGLPSASGMVHVTVPSLTHCLLGGRLEDMSQACSGLLQQYCLQCCIQYCLPYSTLHS